MATDEPRHQRHHSGSLRAGYGRRGPSLAFAVGRHAEQGPMRRITSRFVLMIATAAVAPLIIYGILSVRQLRTGTRESVREGNLRVAQQVAGQIDQYIEHTI